MTRKTEIGILLLLSSLMAVLHPTKPEPGKTALPSLNNCVLGMNQDQCRANLAVWVPFNVFHGKDGGVVWDVKPYFYEFGAEGILRKLNCSRAGILRYGDDSVGIPATTERLRKLLGEPDQAVVYSLVDTGDVEQWYYFRLGLVARVYVSPRRTRVVALTLARLDGPKPGGRRVIRPKEDMPDHRY